MNYYILFISIGCILSHQILLCSSQTCIKGDIRIGYGPDNNYGYLQVCDMQQNEMLGWLYVCRNGWGITDSSVWCQQLGYGSSVDTGLNSGRSDSNEVKIRDVSCSSNDNTISECGYRVYAGRCKYKYNVTCGECNSNISHCTPPSRCINGQCECVSACRNNRVCSGDGMCQCAQGYTGDTCDTVITTMFSPTPPTNRSLLTTPRTQKATNTTTTIINSTNVLLGSTNTTQQTLQVTLASINLSVSSLNNNPDTTTTATTTTTLNTTNIPITTTTTNTTTSIKNLTTLFPETTLQTTDSLSLPLSQFIIPLAVIGSLVLILLLILFFMICNLVLCIYFKRTHKKKKRVISRIPANLSNIEQEYEIMQTSIHHSTEASVYNPVNNQSEYRLLEESIISQLGDNRRYLTGYGQVNSNRNNNFPQYSPAEYISNVSNEIYGDEDINEQTYELMILPSNVRSRVTPSQEERDILLNEDHSYETMAQAKSRNAISKYFPKDPTYWEPPSTLPKLFDIMSKKRYCEIDIQTLKIEAQIGSGQFGIVNKATLSTQLGIVPVAIKSLKHNDPLKKVAFIKEAAIMGQFHHSNIIRLIGVVTLSEPYMIVTELMKTGLDSLLAKLKSTTNSNIDMATMQTVLMKFSVEIAAGMNHLAEKKFVHRDLAARNVLVARDLTCRISDFGMSRETEDNYYTSTTGGEIPLRWTAPEAVFHQKYSEKSDVWSYGMTLYEIWSLGDKPWPGCNVKEIVNRLEKEEMHHLPMGCPPVCSEIMVQCWSYNTHGRQTFVEILDSLRC